MAGLLEAGLAFIASNLFLQIPLSVVQVLLASESEFAAIEPYPVEKTPQDFTIPGVRVNRILPPMITESVATREAVPEVSAEEK
jgi:hypothetical protein